MGSLPCLSFVGRANTVDLVGEKTDAVVVQQWLDQTPWPAPAQPVTVLGAANSGRRPGYVLIVNLPDGSPGDDWESQATEVRGTGAFIIEEGKITGVNNVQITVPAKSINSGKNGMDKKTHEALKASKAPNISFQLTEIKSVNNGAITAAGNLTIAGVTKPVTLSASYKLSGNEVTLTGSYKMNMSTFDIDPPTAMLGAIKTGDEITINYEIHFQNP